MKRSLFIISLLLIAIARISADDSIYTPDPDVSKYEKHVRKAYIRWDALIPTQFVLQNAGNMGIVSGGVGWAYGKHQQWETQLLVGYIPKHQSPRAKLTTTLKENYLPWSINLKRGWSLEPLQASIYINTVYGHEFWKTQPGRYPSGYYEYMSTKFRLNAALGQRITWQIPANKRKYAKSISLFYEISTCDLYIRAKILEHSVPLHDILGLSVGVKLQTL